MAERAATALSRERSESTTPGIKPRRRRHGADDSRSQARTEVLGTHRVGTVRRECLDRIPIVNAGHVQRVLAEYVQHYNRHRPHRALQQHPPDRRPSTVTVGGMQRVRREEVLGGMINEYRLVA
jgi:hypothetical protein